MSATQAVDTVDVVSPLPAEADGLATVLSFLEAHEARRGTTPAPAPAPAYFLSGVGEHEQVELTEQLHAILKQVVQALSRGQSISILTRDQEISTQQAAELLGISRPTVVRLINDGELTAHVPGAERRKLHLADVLAYREALRQRRNRFITDSAAAYDDADAKEVAELLRQARSDAPHGSHDSADGFDASSRVKSDPLAIPPEVRA